jgi:hypothetical protein
MHYSLYTCSSHEAIDTVEMHVLARAYRAAWRAMWARDPAGPHLVHALDLIIDFGPSRAHAALPSFAPPARGGEDAADGGAVGLSPAPPHVDPAQDALVAAAAEFARAAFRDQLGEADATSYFDSHVLAVVDILREIEASEPTLAAGHLLHVVGSTPVTLDQIEKRFGPYVASLVAGLNGAWGGSTQGSPAQREALELDRLAMEGAEVQALRLAQDLANLRDPQWLRQAARNGRLAEIAARADRLVLADAQLLRRVQAALALWQAIPWALEPGPNPR